LRPGETYHIRNQVATELQIQREYTMKTAFLTAIPAILAYLA
jgi:hypothetical protein